MAQLTTMELTVVDLGCERCYKKIKKLLCKFSEIRDQTFNEKENKVTIKVACCSPEKFKSKLIRKGGGTITCIEIKVEKPKTSEPPKKPTSTDDCKNQPQKPEKKIPTPGPVLIPVPWCYKPCNEGQCGGRCNHGCGILRQPPSSDGWPSGCRCNRSYGCRCEFFTEEQPPCTIM